MKFQGVHIFVSIVILAVVSSIIAGFFLVGSPKEERARSLDAQRMSHLMQITSAVDTAWNISGTIPASLDALAMDRSVYVESIQDPETGVPYEYRVISSSTYELCATFALPSSEQDAQMYGTKPISQHIWDHVAGRVCFSLEPITYPK